MTDAWEKLKTAGVVFAFCLGALLMALWYAAKHYAKALYREVKQIAVEVWERT